MEIQLQADLENTIAKMSCAEVRELLATMTRAYADALAALWHANPVAYATFIFGQRSPSPAPLAEAA